MRCRDAEIDDAPALGRIHVAAWRGTYREQMPAAFLAGLDPVRAAERFRARLRAGEPVLLVESAGDVAGFCLFGPSRRTRRPREVRHRAAL